MDIEKYISSGILEAYALGDVTPAERAEVEEMLVKHPEIGAELALIEETIKDIAFHSAVVPHEGLKKKVLGKALAQEPTDPSVPQEEGEKVVSLKRPHEKKRGRLFSYNYYLAAAVSLTLISSFAAFYFFTKWQDAEDRLYSFVVERTALAEQFRTVENQLDSVNRTLAVYTDEHFNQIELQGLALAPKASATVFWNKASGEVFLNPSSLPPTPTDMQYQLWAIVNGQPVDMGVISDGKKGGLLKMKEIGNAAAFAVTLEPAGGSAVPTLEQMYVMGKTS